MDELTTTGPSQVVEYSAGSIRKFEVTPEDAGLPRATLDALKGGDPAHNAAAIGDLLAGQAGAYRDIVVLNAAAALIVAGRTDDLRDGAALAADSIDSGAGKAALERMLAIIGQAV